jgi:hypothetical protein
MYLCRYHISHNSRSNCAYHTRIEGSWSAEDGQSSVSEAAHAPPVYLSADFDWVVKVMANSLPVPGDGGASHTFSYSLSGLLLADTPEAMADYIVLAVARQMRDYRLPDTEEYHAVARNMIKRRFIVEDRFL